LQPDVSEAFDTNAAFLGYVFEPDKEIVVNCDVMMSSVKVEFDIHLASLILEVSNIVSVPEFSQLCYRIRMRNAACPIFFHKTVSPYQSYPVLLQSAQTETVSG